MSSQHEEHAHAAASTPNWKWWFAGGTSIFLFFLYCIVSGGCGCTGAKGHHAPEASSAAAITTDSTESDDTAAKTSSAATHESIKVILPDSVELDAYKGGIEDQLVTFLKSDYKTNISADSLKNIWFDFDNLNFETASAKLTAESENQVKNIAAILKAFPTAKIKIGGYTDKTGDEAANVKLSQGRANAVLTGLKSLGVGAQVEGAEGYGSQFAKFPASASEDERKADRRVSVSVR